MSSKLTVVNAAPVIETTITRAILEGFPEKFPDHLQVNAAITDTGHSSFATALFERKLIPGGRTRAA